MNPAQILPNLPPRAKILLIRLRSLGDIILSTPLYAALKGWRPDLQVSVLVEEPNAEVLLGNPDIQQVFSIPPSGKGGPSPLAARFTTLKSLRTARFDCCINLHGGSTSGFLTWLSRATYRVGLRNFRNPFCYNVHLELEPKNSSTAKRHTVEYQMEWLRCLGVPVNEISLLRIFPDAETEARADARLIQHGIDLGKPYCVIQPASKFTTKEWTWQGFAAISDHLKTQYGYQIALTGGPGEEFKLRQVSDHCQTRPAVLNEIPLSEIIWVIKKAKLFIGNDTGPAHLAAALNTPTVVLFGSSDSQVWYPWKVAHQIVQNPFECNPCPGYRCLVYEQPKCILSITPAQVKLAVERVLSKQ